MQQKVNSMKVNTQTKYRHTNNPLYLLCFPNLRSSKETNRPVYVELLCCCDAVSEVRRRDARLREEVG